MNSRKWLLILSLFVVLMTAFGSISAQNSNLPAFKVSSVIQDEKIVLTTKNFPADTNYVISMASRENPEVFTPVAKFNSKSGGNLNVTVKIPAKFHGLNVIELLIKDADGKTIQGNFVNIPVEEPVEQPVEEPVKEEPTEQPAEEPVKEEPAEQPAEEPVKEEPAEQQVEEPVKEEPAEQQAEEPVKEEPAEQQVEEPVKEEPAEQQVEEPVKEETVEQPAEEPVKEEPAEQQVEEPVKEETVEQPAEEPVKEEPAEQQAETLNPVSCNYGITPYTIINSVVKDSSVTFTTENFPANSTFKVYMGVYVASWAPEPMHPHTPGFYDPRPGRPAPGRPGPDRPDPGRPGSSFYHSYGPDPIPDFEPKHGYDWEFGHHGHGPAPRGVYVTTFDGMETGTFETGNGEPQTLTFDIPASLKGVNPIALWIEDQGVCGFYSYNYFYNNSTLW